MRIALVSTPRSGNTWVRSVLSDLLELESIALHNYLEAPPSLPERCILQIHWYREPNFQKFLAEQEFRIVCLARHPLDVLISVLAFIRHEPLTARWLEGNADIPASLAGCSPASSDFLAYATSFGAENLLSVSYLWWHDAIAIRARYENCAADPVASFSNILRDLGAEPIRDISVTLDKWNLRYFRNLSNQHGWQGRSGLWKDLIPAREAMQIFRRHRNIFDALGYSVEPRWLLTKRQAARNWQKLS